MSTTCFTQEGTGGWTRRVRTAALVVAGSLLAATTSASSAATGTVAGPRDGSRDKASGAAFREPRDSPADTPLATVATIIGTPGNDRLVGTKQRDVIVGHGGDDVLIARGTNDRPLRGQRGRRAGERSIWLGPGVWVMPARTASRSAHRGLTTRGPTSRHSSAATATTC